MFTQQKNVRQPTQLPNPGRYLKRDTIIKAVSLCKDKIDYIDKHTCGCGFTYNLLKPGGLSIKDFNLEHKYSQIICLTPNTDTVIEKFKVNQANDVYYQCEGIGKDNNRCTAEHARVIYTTPDSAMKTLKLLNKERFIFIDEIHKFIDHSSFRSVCLMYKYKKHKVIGVSATFSDKLIPTVKITQLDERQNLKFSRITQDGKTQVYKLFTQQLRDNLQAGKKSMFITKSASYISGCLALIREKKKKVKLIVGAKIQAKINRLEDHMYDSVVDECKDADVILCSNAGVEGWDYNESGDFEIHILLQDAGPDKDIKFSLEEIKQAVGRVRDYNTKVSLFTYCADDAIRTNIPARGEFDVALARGYTRGSEKHLKSFVSKQAEDRQDIWQQTKLNFNEERHTMFYNCETYLDVSSHFDRFKIVEDKEFKLIRASKLKVNQFRPSKKYPLEKLQGLYDGESCIFAYLGHISYITNRPLKAITGTRIKTINTAAYKNLEIDIEKELDESSKKAMQRLRVLLHTNNYNPAYIIKQIRSKKTSVTTIRYGDIFQKGRAHDLDSEDYIERQIREAAIKYKARLYHSGNDILKEIVGLTRSPQTPYRQYNVLANLGGTFLHKLKDILKTYNLNLYIKDCPAASCQCVRDIAKGREIGPDNYLPINAVKRNEAKVQWSKFTNTLNASWDPKGVNPDLVKAFREEVTTKLIEHKKNWHLVYTKWEQNWWYSQKKDVTEKLSEEEKHCVFINRLHDCITVFDPFDIFKGDEKNCFTALLDAWGKMDEERDNPPDIDPEVKDNYTAKN